jgi:hypothetical protein
MGAAVAETECDVESGASHSSRCCAVAGGERLALFVAGGRGAELSGGGTGCRSTRANRLGNTPEHLGPVWACGPGVIVSSRFTVAERSV